MSIDFALAKPGSPEWWLNYLLTRFDAPTRPNWIDWRYDPTPKQDRRTRLNNLWAYYTGRPPLPQVAEGYRDIFRDHMRKARSNYAPMCVNAMLDRMELQGVSTGVDSDVDGDDVAAQIADVSNLVAGLKDLFGYAFSMSEAYALIIPPVGATKVPVVKALDPRFAVGEPDPGNPVQLRAFLSLTWDPVFQKQKALLFLPGKKYTATADGTLAWSWEGEPEDVTGIDELGGVPAIRLDNLNSQGEFEPHLDLLDRINDTTLQRMVLTIYQAFRQRAVVGDLEGDEDDDDGEPDEPIDWANVLTADPGAVWQLPEGVSFWESNQADLTPIITAKRDDVKEFAAVTSTPLHLITPDAANGSAEGASLMREGLNHKVLDRRARFTPAIKLMFRIAFAMAGQPERGEKMRLLWGSIESNSLAEKGSATAQAQGVLSRERILTDIWGMSPQAAKECIQQLTADELLFGSQNRRQPVTTGDRADEL